MWQWRRDSRKGSAARVSASGPSTFSSNIWRATSGDTSSTAACWLAPADRQGNGVLRGHWLRYVVLASQSVAHAPPPYAKGMRVICHHVQPMNRLMQPMPNQRVTDR